MLPLQKQTGMPFLYRSLANNILELKTPSLYTEPDAPTPAPVRVGDSHG